MPRITKPTHRFLARVTHDGSPQVCWAEKVTDPSVESIRAFVLLTPQKKQRGKWVLFSEWEVVVPRTVDRVRQTHIKKEKS